MNTKQIAYLKALAHHLNPVVMIGNQGLTDNVLKEIERSLTAHELIKIKVADDDKQNRQQLLALITKATQATSIYQIGKQLIIFRANNPSKFTLP